MVWWVLKTTHQNEGKTSSYLITKSNNLQNLNDDIGVLRMRLNARTTKSCESLFGVVFVIKVLCLFDQKWVKIDQLKI